MSKSIRISKQYGLNPSVTHCECCGKEIGVALFGTSWKDPKTKKTAEAPRDVAMGLCDQCQSVIDQGGVMIVEVADGEGKNSPENPYRTGRIVGCSKQYKERNNIKTPMVYMEQSMFSQIFGNVEFNKEAS